MTEQMKNEITALVENTKNVFVSSVDENGYPNVAPKRSTRVLSDDSLIFTEGTGGATYANIKRGSKVSVSVVNRDTLDGYRFVGNATLLESGELYDQAAEMSAKMGRPKPFGVVVINIEEIHSLKPGPMAGKRIG
jgi:predicted pyridoxine 5'-phosphate oxidase superfamily flavin-nucleotide-binding protein